jgi:hypothetical protein
MELEITIRGNKVSFNQHCTINEEYDGEDIPHDTPIPINELRQLNFSDGRLTKIPSSIGRLRNLELLDLRNNQLTSLPTTIGNLTKLKYLNLDNNPIRIIPESIGHLSKLTTLELNPDVRIMIEPFRREYYFTSRQVVRVIRSNFDIDQYNILLERGVKNKNWGERKSTALLTEGMKEHFKPSSKYSKHKSSSSSSSSKT